MLFLDKFILSNDYGSIQDWPQVSVIISAHNEEKVIRERIVNLLSLDYDQEKIQIIIGSDGSIDKTNEIVREYEQQGVELFAFEENRGKVNVLNDCVHKVKYDILVLSDANSMFKEDALKKLVAPFQDNSVGCSQGELVYVSLDGSRTEELEGIYWKFEKLLKNLEGRRGCALGANGAIYAIRRELFKPLPEDTIVDDFLIPMRILEKGFKCVYVPQAHASEQAGKHIIQEKKRRVRIGEGNFQNLMHLRSMLNPLKGFSAFCFISHKVLRWFVPVFLIITFISNIFLLHLPFYRVVFNLQCAFYLFAIIGQTLSWSGKQVKLFSICYYFVSMNLALFIGMIRFLTRSQKATWERTER